VEALWRLEGMAAASEWFHQARSAVCQYMVAATDLNGVGAVVIRMIGACRCQIPFVAAEQRQTLVVCDSRNRMMASMHFSAC